MSRGCHDHDRARAGVATDFDTDHTYKLSPQRLLWNIQKLGLLGEIDDYCGVFWWKQAVAQNLSYPNCAVTFTGNWNDQDVVWLHIGGSAIGKTVFGGQDTSNTIALHFANFINAILDGVWAPASGNDLTVTSLSPAPIRTTWSWRLRKSTRRVGYLLNLMIQGYWARSTASSTRMARFATLPPSRP